MDLVGLLGRVDEGGEMEIGWGEVITCGVIGGLICAVVLMLGRMRREATLLRDYGDNLTPAQKKDLVRLWKAFKSDKTFDKEADVADPYEATLSTVSPKVEAAFERFLKDKRGLV
ncbi:hypothetical protein L6258_01500 [Candidatus Parcubacteria bacterium]|nr:hypothetical protein [Candidatus Parcubacteria bacterium]